MTLYKKEKKRSASAAANGGTGRSLWFVTPLEEKKQRLRKSNKD
jgi:hypothetical protein